MSRRRVNTKWLFSHSHTPPTSSQLHAYTHTFIVSICFFLFISSVVLCTVYGMQFRAMLLFVFSLCTKCCEMYKVMMIYGSERTKNGTKERQQRRKASKRERDRDGTLFFFSSPLKNRCTCVWLKILIVWAFILCTPILRSHPHKYTHAVPWIHNRFIRTIRIKNCRISFFYASHEHLNQIMLQCGVFAAMLKTATFCT